MSLSITVTYQTGSGFTPGYLVTVSGLTTITDYDTVTLTRNDVDGQVDVRGMSEREIVASSQDTVDYEYHYQNQGVSKAWDYTATVYDATGVALSSVTSTPKIDGVQSVTDMLTDFPTVSAVMTSVQQPAISLPITISEFPGWSIPARVLSTTNVLGRPRPVVQTDAMGGRTGGLVLLCIEELSTLTQEDLEQILTYNDSFMLQLFWRTAGYKDMFFKVTGDISIERVTLPIPLFTVVGGTVYSVTEELPVFKYTVPFTEIDRPATTSPVTPIVSWQDVLDNFTSWQDVLNTRASWLDLLNDTQS